MNDQFKGWISTWDKNFNWNFFVNVPVYALIEYNNRIEWGKEDITPFVRKVKLEKCNDSGAEYRWKLLDVEKDESLFLLYDFDVTMIKLIS